MTIGSALADKSFPAHSGQTMGARHPACLRRPVAAVYQSPGEAADGVSGLNNLQSSQRMDLLIIDIGLPGLRPPALIGS